VKHASHFTGRESRSEVSFQSGVAVIVRCRAILENGMGRTGNGIPASQVASFALFDWARTKRCPSVICLGVCTQRGRATADWESESPRDRRRAALRTTWPLDDRMVVIVRLSYKIVVVSMERGGKKLES
jgi:hypothetical protein